MALFACGLAMVACKDKGNGDAPPAPAEEVVSTSLPFDLDDPNATFQATLHIADRAGPLAGATVKLDTQTLTADADGNVVLADVKVREAPVVEISHDGYFTSYAPLAYQNAGKQPLRVVLVKGAAHEIIDNATGGSIKHGGVEIGFAANAMVDESGQPVEGSFPIAARTVNPLDYFTTVSASAKASGNPHRLADAPAELALTPDADLDAMPQGIEFAEIEGKLKGFIPTKVVSYQSSPDNKSSTIVLKVEGIDLTDPANQVFQFSTADQRWVPAACSFFEDDCLVFEDARYDHMLALGTPVDELYCGNIQLAVPVGAGVSNVGVTVESLAGPNIYKRIAATSADGTFVISPIKQARITTSFQQTTEDPAVNGKHKSHVDMNLIRCDAKLPAGLSMATLQALPADRFKVPPTKIYVKTDLSTRYATAPASNANVPDVTPNRCSDPICPFGWVCNPNVPRADDPAKGICYDPSPCTSVDTCGYGGTCERLELDAYECSCDEGYDQTSVTNPCNDIDECARDVGLCPGDSICENTPGSYQCTCPAGYLFGVSGCEDVDECATSTDDCNPNSTCDNQPGSFSCLCEPGFSYVDAATGCVDDDECALNTDGCHASSTCLDLDGGFECACPEGQTYSGDVQGCVSAAAEICNDFIDNDGDTFFDCEDSDCVGDPACTFEICGNGIDDDGNTAIDCDDPFCFDFPGCGFAFETTCDDNVDNDFDSLTDCDDPDCLVVPICF